MALFNSDMPALVAALSPPMDAESAECELRRIFKELGWKLLLEQQANQESKRDTDNQLLALSKALDRLGSRAKRALGAAIDEVQGDRGYWPDLSGGNYPAPRVPGALIVLALPEAAVAAARHIPQRNTSATSDATRKAVRALVDLYCSNGRPRPYHDRNTGGVKHRDGLVFAGKCLASWGCPGVSEADTLVWCLQ